MRHFFSLSQPRVVSKTKGSSIYSLFARVCVLVPIILAPVCTILSVCRHPFDVRYRTISADGQKTRERSHKFVACRPRTHHFSLFHVCFSLLYTVCVITLFSLQAPKVDFKLDHTVLRHGDMSLPPAVSTSKPALCMPVMALICAGATALVCAALVYRVPCFPRRVEKSEGGGGSCIAAMVWEDIACVKFALSPPKACPCVLNGVLVFLRRFGAVHILIPGSRGGEAGGDGDIPVLYKAHVVCYLAPFFRVFWTKITFSHGTRVNISSWVNEIRHAYGVAPLVVVSTRPIQSAISAAVPLDHLACFYCCVARRSIGYRLPLSVFCTADFSRPYCRPTLTGGSWREREGGRVLPGLSSA